MNRPKATKSSYGLLMALGLFAVLGTAFFIATRDDGPPVPFDARVATREIQRDANACAPGFAQLCLSLFTEGLPNYQTTVPQAYVSTNKPGFDPPYNGEPGYLSNRLDVAPPFAPYRRDAESDTNWTTFGVEPEHDPFFPEPSIQIIDLGAVTIHHLKIAKSSRRLARVDWSARFVPTRAYYEVIGSLAGKDPLLLAAAKHAGKSTGIIHAAFFFNGTRWIYDPGRLALNQFSSPTTFAAGSLIWLAVAIGTIVIAIIVSLIVLVFRIRI
jgi:hypothetical protein